MKEQEEKKNRSMKENTKGFPTKEDELVSMSKSLLSLLTPYSLSLDSFSSSLSVLPSSSFLSFA
jgi:hypothetical protein